MNKLKYAPMWETVNLSENERNYLLEILKRERKTVIEDLEAGCNAVDELYLIESIISKITD